MLSAADVYQAILKDATEHPGEFVLKLWGVISGTITGGWVIFKLFYETRKATRHNARDLLTFLEIQPVLYDGRDTEAPHKIYVAADIIRKNIKDFLPKTHGEQDRKDVKGIVLACNAFINDRDAFPDGMPQPAQGLNDKQWHALRLLRSKVIPLGFSIAARYGLPNPETLEDWQSYVPEQQVNHSNAVYPASFRKGAFIQVKWNSAKLGGRTDYGTIVEANSSIRSGSEKEHIAVTFMNRRDESLDIAATDLDTIHLIDKFPDIL